MNRATLLARLRKEFAYEGDGSLDDVRKFVSDNAIELQDSSGKILNLDKLWSAKTVLVTATEGEDVQLSTAGQAGMDDDDEDGKAADDDDEDDDGEKRVTLAEARRLLAQGKGRDGKAKGGKAATSDRRAGAVMASVHQGRNDRNAAHKAYNHRVDLANRGHKFGVRGAPVFPDAETAEAFGAMVRSKWFGVWGDEPRAEDRDICKSYFGSKTQVENVNSAGGALVFPEFSDILVSLFEEYGIARRLFNVISMGAETHTFSRESTRPTVSAIGEAASVTESEGTYGNITLVAKKFGGITRHSNELLADSALNFADIIARAWAWSFTKFEDDAAFLGDGTSTYGGIMGVNPSLLDVDGAGTDSAGVIEAAASTASDWANFTISEFLEAQGALPNYVQNPTWVCHKAFYYSGWGEVALSAGGAFAAEYEAGLAQNSPRILGMPVLFHQSFPSSASDTSADEIVITLGDYAKGCAFGDRQSVEIVGSRDRYFDTDEFALRAIERFDIKPHDVGDSSTVGPVVGITAE